MCEFNKIVGSEFNIAKNDTSGLVKCVVVYLNFVNVNDQYFMIIQCSV